MSTPRFLCSQQYFLSSYSMALPFHLLNSFFQSLTLFLVLGLYQNSDEAHRFKSQITVVTSLTILIIILCVEVSKLEISLGLSFLYRKIKILVIYLTRLLSKITEVIYKELRTVPSTKLKKMFQLICLIVLHTQFMVLSSVKLIIYKIECFFWKTLPSGALFSVFTILCSTGPNMEFCNCLTVQVLSGSD